MTLQLPELIGLVGVALILISYFLLQIERIRSEALSYSVMNLVGSSLILYSLFYNWNLPSFIIEIFWIGISVYGVAKWIRHRSPGQPAIRHK